MTGPGIEQIDPHHHDLFLIGTDDWYSVVHAVTASVSIMAAVPAVPAVSAVVAVIVPFLTQAGFQTQVGGDEEIRRVIVVQRP